MGAGLEVHVDGRPGASDAFEGDGLGMGCARPLVRSLPRIAPSLTTTAPTRGLGEV